MRFNQVLRSVAAGAAAVLAIGIAGAGPASAAPKPRLPISFTAQPSDPSGSSTAAFSWTTVVGATYTCTLDGGAATSCTSPTTYTGLADGVHTLVVKGRKNGTNRPGTATARWTVDSVPPGAPVIAPVATPTRTTAASISFTNPDVTAVAHLCALDGAAAVTCTSPWAVAGPLADGSHTVTVQSRGLTGTLGGTSSVTWVVDATAPESVLLTGPASPTSSTSASFTFSSVGAATFGCALDGAAAVPCTSPYVVSPVAEGSHTMVVSAADAVGNAAQPGTTVWTVDTTAPPVPSILTGPAAVTNQAGVDFLVSNPDGSATLECRLDSNDPAAWATCPSPLHLVVATETSHALEVRAVDTAGNASAVAGPFTWTLDLTSPAPAQFLTGPASPTKSTTAEFDFVPSDPADPDFDHFSCSFDGGAYVDCDTDTVPLGSGPLTEGTHTLDVKTVDAASPTPNVSAAARWTWVVDLTAPAAPSFSQAPAASTTSTSATFAFSSEAGASLGCSLDGGALVPCSSPYAVSGLALGGHTFRVVVTDAALNSSEATHAWTVAAPTGPVTPPTPPAPGSPALTTATITPSTALTGRSTVAFSADVTGVAASTVTLRPAGGTPVAATLACLSAAGSATACTGAVRSLGVTPVKALVPGQTYQLAVSGVTDGSGRPVSASSSFRASVSESEASAAASFRWRKAKAAGAYGRSYLVSDRKGASLTYRFTGRKVTWFTTTGPAQGRAKVFVDGVLKGRVDNWSARNAWRVGRTVTGLKAGSHVLKVVVTGRRSAAATGTNVVVDAVRVGKATVARTPTVTAGWRSAKATSAAGGRYATEHLKGAATSFVFHGTSVTWVTATGATMGRAKVYVDGVLKATVDNYAKRARWGVRRTVAGLSSATHTVTVVVTGAKRRAATGTDVVVDRWLVG